MYQRVPFFCPAISGIGEDTYRLRNQAIRRIQVMHILPPWSLLFRQACGRINSNMSFHTKVPLISLAV